MADKFKQYLEYVLRHEGGFQADARDPGNANGGATNYGITQRVYNDYLAASGKKSQSVAAITRREVEAIYRVKYWLSIRGDELPAGWDYAIFDFGINSGPKRAIRYAQMVVGAEVDGAMGPATLAALRAAPREALDKYLDLRLSFLKELPHWKDFGKGWERRVNDVKEKMNLLLPADKK